MKLKNGSDEEMAVIAPIMSALQEIRQDFGWEGLRLTRWYALGSVPKAREMLTDYGLVDRATGNIRKPVINVILSAITVKYELVTPYEKKA